MKARTLNDIAKLRYNLERAAAMADGIVGTGYFKVGLDPVIGLAPVLGEIYTVGTGGYLIMQAWRAHVPAAPLFRMSAVLVFDLVVGSIPVAGDIADFILRGHAIAAEIALKHLDSTHYVEGTPINGVLHALPEGKTRIVYLQPQHQGAIL